MIMASPSVFYSAIAVACCIILTLLMLVTKELPVLFVPLLVPAILLVLRLPIWICLLFIVFSFFRIHEAVPMLIPFHLPQLLAVAALGSLLWHIFISRRITPFWHPLHSSFSMFFLLILLGAFLATNRGLSIAAITDTFSKIALMLLAISWLIRSPKDFNLATWLIVIAGVFIGSIAIYNRLNGIGLVEGTRVTIGRNIGAMIGDPNDLALVLTFPLSFAASLFAERKLGLYSRFCLALPALTILSWAILCTQSRGGLLGMTTVAAVILWYRVKNKWLVFSVGGSLLLVLVVVAGISGRASGGAAEDGIDESAMGRIYAWQAATNMALARPLTGVGIGNFYSNYYAYSPHWDGKNHAVHSTWFQILAESGFVGFSIFLAMVVKTFRQAFINQRLAFESQDSHTAIVAQALLAGLCSFCISGTFLTQGFIWPLYILIALTVALTRYLNDSNDTTVKSQNLSTKETAS